MSCLPEVTYSSYVDGELSPDETRHVEAHLVTCQACRALVVALRDEVSALTDALHERSGPVVAAAASPLPEPGLTIGLPIAIAATTLVLGVGSFLVETGMPGGLDLLNPLRFKGVTEMLFDLVFLVRDRADGILEFALSVGAVAAVSALLTFGVGVLVRRTAGPAALALAGALLFAPPDAARALELRIDEDTRIAAGETIAETLIASGDLVEIDGKIDGDLIAATKRLVVRGVVTGSIYAFARDIEIVGTVKGGIVAIGERVRVDGAVAGNAYAACERFTIAPHGRVGGDVALFADEAEINGAAGRDVVFAGDRIEVRAAIGRNFEAPRADQVVLGEGARIAGDVDASLPRGTEIEMAPGARVAGEIRTTPRGPLHARYLAHYTELHFYLFLAIELVAGLAFGLLLYRFAPQLFSSRVATAGAFFRTTGIGFLFLLAAPIAILLVGLTIIGLPIALLGLFSYVVAVYCSDIMVGALIGNALMGQRDPSLGAFARAFVPGFAIVIVAHGIPFLGPAVAIVMLLFGSGLVFERGRQLRLSSAPV